METGMDSRRWADISTCGRYRYTLGERWVEGPLAIFILCNPSTADVREDDHTSRKCRGFAKRWDMAGWCILNPFAFRSRHPGALLSVVEPQGLQNEAFWHKTLSAEQTGIFVAGWGHALPQPLRLDAHKLIVRFSNQYRLTPKCFGLTKSDQPLHPLTLGYNRPLIPFYVDPEATKPPARVKPTKISQAAPRKSW
jgi:hypothetical protein